jgi:hypothetical protein
VPKADILHCGTDLKLWALCQKMTYAPQQTAWLFDRSRSREQLGGILRPSVFRLQVNQETGLAYLEVATAAVCSGHLPGSGPARLVATAAVCWEQSPRPGFAWSVAAMAAFCSERSFGRSVARPIPGNTRCKLSTAPCAESPGTSRPRFPFAPQHKTFAHQVRTMLGGRFL